MPKCKMKTRVIPATFAWLLLLGTTFSFFYYPCQYYIFKYPWVPAYQGVITFFVIANFTLATFMDPGVIPKGKDYLFSLFARKFIYLVYTLYTWYLFCTLGIYFVHPVYKLCCTDSKEFLYQMTKLSI